MEWQYYVGDCSDPAVQEQAKQNFIDGFNSVFGSGDPNFCQNMGTCSMDNINIACGKVEDKRGRRQAQASLKILQ